MNLGVRIGWAGVVAMVACAQRTTSPSTPSPATPPRPTARTVDLIWVVHNAKDAATLDVRAVVDGKAQTARLPTNGHDEWHAGDCERSGATRGFPISATTGIGYDLERGEPRVLNVVYRDDEFPFYSTCSDEEGHSVSCPPIRHVAASFTIPDGARVRVRARVDDGPEVELVACGLAEGP